MESLRVYWICFWTALRRSIAVLEGRLEFEGSKATTPARPIESI
jgi:hypothetical protein